MPFKTPIILSLAAVLALTACDPFPQGDPNQTRTRTGAATGALIGGLIGATSNSSERPLATIAGAVAGAAIGGAIGNSLDRQAADLRAQTSGNVGVQQVGGQLVVTMPQDLLFATDSAALRPDLQADLRAVAANLRQYPGSLVRVIGHTDNTGDAGYNRDLSQRRAASVASVLIREGVESGRVVPSGMGEDMPVASNLTPEGRAQNRRVEIIIQPPV